MNRVFVDDKPMRLQQALDLADHASPTPEDACRALRTLRAHIEVQQKEAVRYRWLRASRLQFLVRNNNAEISLRLPPDAICWTDAEVDAHIDSTMMAQSALAEASAR